MNRRSFLIQSGVLVIGGMALQKANAQPFCSSVNQSLQGQIGFNHGHVLLIPRADIDAGTAKAYDIRGTSGHTHSVSVGQDLFAKLGEKGRVDLMSSGEIGHSHPITLICAS